MEITSRMEVDTESDKSLILLKVAFDKDVFGAIHIGEFAGIGDRIAKEIAQKLYPKIEDMVFSDHTMLERIKDKVAEEIGFIWAKTMREVVAKKEGAMVSTGNS